MEGSGEFGGTSGGFSGAGAPSPAPSFDSSVGQDAQSFDTDFEAETFTPQADMEANVSSPTFDNASFDDFVSSPASAHDKLVSLSEMDEEEPSLLEVQKSEEKPNEKGPEQNEAQGVTEQVDQPKETDEQALIKLQKQAMELAMKSMSGSNNKELEKDIKELLAQLKFLMEKMGQQEGASLTGSALQLILMLLTLGTEAERKMQNEVERASA
jgi:hypothetical protein